MKIKSLSKIIPTFILGSAGLFAALSLQAGNGPANSTGDRANTSGAATCDYQCPYADAGCPLEVRPCDVDEMECPNGGQGRRNRDGSGGGNNRGNGGGGRGTGNPADCPNK